MKASPSSEAQTSKDGQAPNHSDATGPVGFSAFSALGGMEGQIPRAIERWRKIDDATGIEDTPGLP